MIIKNIKGKQHLMTNITFSSCTKLTIFGYLCVVGISYVHFCLNPLCVITQTLTSSPALRWSDTFSQDSFCEMLRHTALFTWRREATATSEINPLWTRMSLPHTCTHRRTKGAAGLAVQPSLNESVGGWYDWDRWPFGTGMTKQWPQHVSLLQKIWTSSQIDGGSECKWLPHMLKL